MTIKYTYFESIPNEPKRGDEMIYRQSSIIRKSIELILVIAGLGMIDQILGLEMREWTLNPFLITVLLFSLRYGLTIGISSFLLVLAYYLADMVIGGGDVFLVFYSFDRFINVALLLLVAVIGGMYGTSFRERYESLSDRNSELYEENENVKEVIQSVEESMKAMQNRVLESEYTLTRIYQVGKALDQPTPYLIRNEAIEIISDLFQSREVAIYHVDASFSAMRLSVKRGGPDAFLQTIFVSGEDSMLQRLFSNKTVTIRSVEDDEDAPVLAGPIIQNGKVQEVLIINDLDFERLTNYEIQILSVLLDWLSDRIEKSRASMQKEEEKKMYPGTRIYFKEAFEEKVIEQQDRKEKFDVDYSVIEVPYVNAGTVSKVEMEIILRSYLREVDIVGFEEGTGVFYFLLPGTGPENAGIVKDRIQKVMDEKVVQYVQ